MSNQLDPFLSRNRLAIRISMLAFPISELLGLAGVLPIVLPVGQVLALAILTILSIALDFRNSNGVDRFRNVACLLWIGCATLPLIWFGVKRFGVMSVLDQFQVMLFPVLAFALLSRLLVAKISGYARVFSCLAAIGCLFVGAIMAWAVLDAAVRYLPVVYDPVLYRIDSILGLRVFYSLADFLNTHQNLRGIVVISYKYNLVFALPVIFSEAFYGRKFAMELTIQLFVSSFLVFPLFCMLPALDPAFFFQGAFPDNLPAILPPHSVLAHVANVRNTFPSLHATWAILLCLALVDSPLWQRAAGYLYLAVTVLATIGFGEHYVVDWVGAVPFVLLVRGLCASGLAPGAPPRLSAMIVGFCFIMLWIVVGRTAPMSLSYENMLRGFAILSVVAPVMLERWLRLAERQSGLVVGHRRNTKRAALVHH